MKKYTYDTSKYKFRELVSNLFGVSNLEKIHEIKREWIEGDYDKVNNILVFFFKLAVFFNPALIECMKARTSCENSV